MRVRMKTKMEIHCGHSLNIYSHSLDANKRHGSGSWIKLSVNIPCVHIRSTTGSGSPANIQMWIFTLVN